MRWSHLYLANKNYGEVRLGLTATPKYDVTKDTLESITTEPGKGRYRSSFAPFGGGTGLSKDDPLLAASVGYEKFRDGSILRRWSCSIPSRL